MLNMVQANLFRLIRTRFSWAIPVALAAYGALAPFLFWEKCRLCATFRQLLEQVALGEVVCAAAVFWLAVFFAEDFARATVRNLMAGPQSRLAYVGAALATTLLWAIALLLLSVAALALGAAAAGCLPAQIDGAQLLLWALMWGLLIAGFVMVALLAAMPWGSGAVTAAVLVAAALWTRAAYWFFAVAAQGLPAGAAQWVSDCLQPLLPTSLRIAISQGAPLEGWWFADAAAVVLVATVAIGTILRRKELR